MDGQFAFTDEGSRSDTDLCSGLLHLHRPPLHVSTAASLSTGPVRPGQVYLLFMGLMVGFLAGINLPSEKDCF